MTETAVFDEEQEAFLGKQKWAVLATGRSDGSPQVSTIGYVWNGKTIVISAKSYTAKWKNVLRQPRVALLVNEGRKQLVVYGRAEPIAEDPERLALTRSIFERLSGKPVDTPDETLRAALDEQKRTILRVTPEKAMMND